MEAIDFTFADLPRGNPNLTPCAVCNTPPSSKKSRRILCCDLCGFTVERSLPHLAQSAWNLANNNTPSGCTVTILG